MPEFLGFSFQPTEKEYEEQELLFGKLITAEEKGFEAKERWYGEATKGLWMGVERDITKFIGSDKFPASEIKKYDLPKGRVIADTLIKELRRLNPELFKDQPLSWESMSEGYFPPAWEGMSGVGLLSVPKIRQLVSDVATGHTLGMGKPMRAEARAEFPSFAEARRTGTARYMPIESLTESPSLGELLSGRLSELRESPDEGRYTSLMQLEDIEAKGLSDLVRLQAETLDPERSHEQTVKWTEYLREGGVPI